MRLMHLFCTVEVQWLPQRAASLARYIRHSSTHHEALYIELEAAAPKQPCPTKIFSRAARQWGCVNKLIHKDNLATWLSMWGSHPTAQTKFCHAKLGNPCCLVWRLSHISNQASIFKSSWNGSVWFCSKQPAKMSPRTTAKRTQISGWWQIGFMPFVVKQLGHRLTLPCPVLGIVLSGQKLLYHEATGPAMER